MKTQTYLKLVKASAIYDLLVTSPFATPWTFALSLQVLNSLSPLPPFEPMHAFFVNLLGSLVVVWSVFRLYRTQPIYGLFDSASRLLFAIWQVYYLLLYQVTPVLWGFLVFEVGFGVFQFVGYQRVKRAS